MQAMLEFRHQNPVFIDFTWGAGGVTSDLTPALCKKCVDLGLVANMHLTCTNMPVEKVKIALDFCYSNGIRNIVALRGDPPAGQDRWKATEGGFTCGLDLVKHIRATYGDYFCITVAGYPEGHPDKIDPAMGLCSEESMAEEIDYLKAKIDAGADFIITQLFYDNAFFFKFLERCKAKGITCPILPGLVPMLSYAGFKRMIGLCRTYVPPQLHERMEALKEDDAAVKAYGVELITEMIRELIAAGVPHIHFYTLNLTPSTFAILRNLNMLQS